MLKWLKAFLHAQKNQKLAESRYKEASEMRRMVVELRMERDYWKQRFEGLKEMVGGK